MTHRKMRHALYLQTQKKLTLFVTVSNTDMNNTDINLKFKKQTLAH